MKAKCNLALIFSVSALFLCLFGCNKGDKYSHEQFYGVVRFSEEADRLVIYVQNLGDVEIPENEGCCSCFDGHEPNENYSYQLKAGDLVKINFKYEKAWDDGGVAIMETYPARFNRSAGLIEVLRENVFFEKVDGGYSLSFPKTPELETAALGDTVYFINHESKGSRDMMSLYAEGNIADISGDIITVSLTFHENESSFLENYPTITPTLEWED